MVTIHIKEGEQPQLTQNQFAILMQQARFVHRVVVTMAANTTKLRNRAVIELYWLTHPALPRKLVGIAGFLSFRTPPNSPDLAPSDFLLFLKLKAKLKSNRFTDNDEVKEAICDFFDDKDAFKLINLVFYIAPFAATRGPVQSSRRHQNI